MRKEVVASLRSFMATAGFWTVLAWPEPGKTTYTTVRIKYAFSLEEVPTPDRNQLGRVASLIEQCSTPATFEQNYHRITDIAYYKRDAQPKPDGSEGENVFVFDTTGRNVVFYDWFFSEDGNNHQAVFSGRVNQFKKFLLSSPHYFKQ